MSKYNEIVNYLLGKIARSEIKLERRLPTIRELSELFQCSQGTAVRAYIPDSGFFACGEFLNNADVGKLIGKLDDKNIIIHNIGENYLDAYYKENLLKLSVSTASLNNIKDGVDTILAEIVKMN